MLAITGAKIAINMIVAMATRPAIANRSFRKARQKICQGLRPMIDAGVSADGPAASRSARWSASRSSTLGRSDWMSERLMPGPGYYARRPGPAMHRPCERYARRRFEGQGCESCRSSVLHDQGERLRIEARAAYERAVDLGVRHEPSDVPRRDAAAVLDAEQLSHLRRESLGQHRPDHLHDLARIGGFGVASGADRPDRLVGNDGLRGGL